MIKPFLRKTMHYIGPLLIYAGAYFLLDVFVALLVAPDAVMGLWFTAVWSLLFASVVLLLPRLGGRILFGVSYGLCLIWSLVQTGYHSVFNKLMWVRDLFYVGEGVGFLGDTLRTFSAAWWIGGILLIALWVVLIWKFPRRNIRKIPFTAVGAAALALLFVLPNLLFHGDADYRAAYDSLTEAKRGYSVCGLYQLTARDIWLHEIYPQTPAYETEKTRQTEQIRGYFTERTDGEANEMTGLFADKNVVLVLMESMDDWLITEENTPTLYRLMDEGINFTQFYTPGYGTARTLNTEFCMNTGIYLPTSGEYVFDYLENDFSQSLASQAVKDGYSAEVFHYNTPDFYSRGVLEPAMGYASYNSYGDYIQPGREDQIYDDCMLFDVAQLRDYFFRDEKNFNTIITRSAHLGYSYDEELSEYALSVYPEYRGKYGVEEVDCIRVKAKLVDDMFARLLEELEASGRLENTVIIGITDHYAYGMDDTELLMELSGVEETLMLERTPCFIWSADGPDMDVDKTLCTADFVPTVLNLLGIDSPYDYLGHDAFDDSYPGYALFPDGSWIRDGVACRVNTDGEVEIIANLTGRDPDPAELEEMASIAQQNIQISNMLLTSDYYSLTP